MQGSQHAILFDLGRVQLVLHLGLLLDNAFLDKVLIDRVAQGDDPSSEPMRMILGLQLHFLLLLVHLDRMETILI